MVRSSNLRCALAALGLVLAPHLALAETRSEHLDLCAGPADVTACRNAQAEFQNNIVAAYYGDYQAQRNVAFCLQDGCYGAVRRNPTLACAWRQVILLSGSPRVDPTDQSNFRHACKALDAAEAATADAQAGRIRTMIGR